MENKLTQSKHVYFLFKYTIRSFCIHENIKKLHHAIYICIYLICIFYDKSIVTSLKIYRDIYIYILYLHMIINTIRLNTCIYNAFLYRQIGQFECSFPGTIDIDFRPNKNYCHSNNYYYLSALTWIQCLSAPLNNREKAQVFYVSRY